MDKKELILLEAAKLFAEKGYYGLGLSELLKRCDIPKGSFYYYFPDGKIQLIQEVLTYSYGKMKAAIDIWMQEEATALSAFMRMADNLIHGVERKRPMSSLLMSMIAIESVFLDEKVNATCSWIYHDWQQYYAQKLEHFGFPVQESKRVAQAVFSLIHGSLISSWIKQNPEDLQMAKETLQHVLKK